jgi:GMP synthase-like glutamine amidotransferase
MEPDGYISRRQFLKSLAVGGAALGALAFGACQEEVEAPREVTKVVERTKVVEVTVEVITVVEKTPELELEVAKEDELMSDAMVWYVDIEHKEALADPERAPNFDKVRRQRAMVLEDIAGIPCEAILYTDVSLELARQKNVKAIGISGNTTDWEFYDFKTFEPLFEIVKSGEVPTIGFCGGHQLIGLMYGSECGAMRKLRAGETDPGGFAPGWFKEVGYMPVQVVQGDPIFDGLGKEPVFFESHYWEIKQVPPGFELLASTENCKVQTIRSSNLAVYGTQFHPEVNSAEHRDGRKLIENFFRIAGVLGS